MKFIFPVFYLVFIFIVMYLMLDLKYSIEQYGNIKVDILNIKCYILIKNIGMIFQKCWGPKNLAEAHEKLQKHRFSLYPNKEVEV